MGLFSKKKTDLAVPGVRESFQKASETLGIKSEDELKQRALIMLNDEDGIVEAEAKAKMKMDAYRSGAVHEFHSFEDPAVRATNYFTGCHNGKNNICMCTNLDDINLQNIKKITCKLVFFPTETTPHFVGKIAIDDGTLEASGEISPYCMDINFNMAYLGMRIAIYELITFPNCSLNLIDSKYEGESDGFEYTEIAFQNSLAVRSNFLREGEAYINSLSEYSIFSQESDSSGELYNRCFDNAGNAIDQGAKACFQKRMEFDPRPITVADWIRFSV